MALLKRAVQLVHRHSSKREEAVERSHPQGGPSEVLQLPLPVSSDFLEKPRVLSPKKPPIDTAGLADIFPYYAGFAFDWARKQLNELSAGDPRKVVLDPWNGSGTTTLAAQCDGHPSFGVDRNPVANLVAQLRCQVGAQGQRPFSPQGSVEPLGGAKDALSNWFAAATVKQIREWTSSLHGQPLEARVVGLVSLFRVVRMVTKKFEGTNPTWVKRARTYDELIEITHADLDSLIAAEQEYLIERLKSSPFGSGTTTLLTASSDRLPIGTGSIDVILTSPLPDAH